MSAEGKCEHGEHIGNACPICEWNAGRSLAAPAGSVAHPAILRTWWVNLYPNGQITSALCKTREEALNRCTYTGDTPDAKQVEVRLVPLNAPHERPGANNPNA